MPHRVPRREQPAVRRHAGPRLPRLHRRSAAAGGPAPPAGAGRRGYRDRYRKRLLPADRRALEGVPPARRPGAGDPASPRSAVLDEPTEGLDPNQRVEIRRLIGALGKDRTVILSTHVLSEVQQTCSRLLIISRGKIVADGPVDRLIAQAAGAIEVAVEAAGAGVAEALGQLPGVRRVTPAPVAIDGRVAVTLTADGARDLRPEIFALAQSRGWTL